MSAADLEASSPVPALQLDAVRKVYRSGDEEVVALDHVSLTIGGDELVALVGPSGSGKTTLCSIAGGILSPTEGTVTVTGDDISGYSRKELTDFRRAHVGFVFQSVNLVPFLTAARTFSSSTRSANVPELRRASVPTSSSASSASRTGPGTCPRNCPVGSASGSRSGAH